MSKATPIRFTFHTLAALLALVAPSFARQQDGLVPQSELPSDVAPGQLDGVEVLQKLDAALPLDAKFTNADGKDITFADLFDGKIPAFLTFNYSSCPNLCSEQLSRFSEALGDVDLVPGKDFRVITVLIDPLETWKRGRITKNKWLQHYTSEGAEAGWEFLVGKDKDIHAVADAAGFKYRFVRETGEYAHSAAVIVVTPQGHISRYFAGLEYPAAELKRALVDAGGGKIGTITDNLFLWCFHYDPTTSKYTPILANIMKLGGALMVLAFGVFFFFMVRFEKARNRALAAATTGPTLGAGPKPC